MANIKVSVTVDGEYEGYFANGNPRKTEVFLAKLKLALPPFAEVKYEETGKGYHELSITTHEDFPIDYTWRTEFYHKTGFLAPVD